MNDHQDSSENQSLIPEREPQPELRNPGLIREFIHFVRNEKKYWMIPLIIVILFLSFMFYAAANNIWASFLLYPLF
ncbi:MAG: DUF5989 family protein [Planctomycetes bacterium]|nr:DUF5989 family protein [Planctomycetota bacterium]